MRRTAPLKTSGAIVRYRMRCWEPSSRSTTYSLTPNRQQSAPPVFVQKKHTNSSTATVWGWKGHLKGQWGEVYLWSSVSGSTRMFSCVSFTRRNTKESRKGSGTASTSQHTRLLVVRLLRHVSNMKTEDFHQLWACPSSAGWVASSSALQLSSRSQCCCSTCVQWGL